MNKIIAAAAVAAGISAGPAHAVCTQADIGGTWEFYGDVYSATKQFSSYALRCTLHIDKTSGHVATESACESTAVNGQSVHRGNVTFGNILITDPDNCTFSVRFGSNAGIVSVGIQSLFATMAPSKEIVAGMLGDNLNTNNRGGSIFTMVKIH
jgi:hypothetical protein